MRSLKRPMKTKISSELFGSASAVAAVLWMKMPF
jgi:hypothetical protein